MPSDCLLTGLLLIFCYSRLLVQPPLDFLVVSGLTICLLMQIVSLAAQIPPKRKKMTGMEERKQEKGCQRKEKE